MINSKGSLRGKQTDEMKDSYDSLIKDDKKFQDLKDRSNLLFLKPDHPLLQEKYDDLKHDKSKHEQFDELCNKMIHEKAKSYKDSDLQIAFNVTVNYYDKVLQRYANRDCYMLAKFKVDSSGEISSKKIYYFVPNNVPSTSSAKHYEIETNKAGIRDDIFKLSDDISTKSKVRITAVKMNEIKQTDLESIDFHIEDFQKEQIKKSEELNFPQAQENISHIPETTASGNQAQESNANNTNKEEHNQQTPDKIAEKLKELSTKGKDDEEYKKLCLKAKESFDNGFMPKKNKIAYLRGVAIAKYIQKKQRKDSKLEISEVDLKKVSNIRLTLDVLYRYGVNKLSKPTRVKKSTKKLF